MPKTDPMTMKFEKAHESFFHDHLEKRSGERRDRLKRGHKHAEKMFLQNVWYPLKGHFENLHPEYEVLDWRGRPYYIDLAYILPHIKIGWEILGYGPHVRDIDRRKFSQELMREAFLNGLGWKIVSFSYDDVVNNPELCQTMVQMILSQYIPVEVPADMIALTEKEIIRLACNAGRPLRPVDVSKHLNVDYRTAKKWIDQLCHKQILKPIINGRIIRHYELEPNFLRYWS